MEPCSSKKSIFNFFQKNKRKENQVTKEADLKSQKIVKKLSIFGNVRETKNKITKKIHSPDIQEKSIDLPDEVLLYIFHFFVKLPNFKIDDLANLRLVSRQYKLVSQDNSLWRLFLHQKVQNRFPKIMNWEIFVKNFKRAVAEAKKIYRVYDEKYEDLYLNKLTFFSEVEDSYGILEPHALTKLVLKGAKLAPQKVIRKMDEFAISSKKCRFKMALRFAKTYDMSVVNCLKNNLEKFDLSKEHKKKIKSKIRFYQDLKEREERKRWNENKEERADEEEIDLENLYEEPDCILF
jgi:hypothetical protein